MSGGKRGVDSCCTKVHPFNLSLVDHFRLSSFGSPSTGKIAYRGVMKRMFVLLALIGAPVTAQQSKPEIIVEGHAVSPADARQYVTQITDTREGQIARFHRPVCPIVVGLPDETNAKILARIRKTAQSLGAELGSEQCDANLVMLVTDNSDQSLSDLRRTRESWFDGLSHAEIETLVADKSAARAWSVVSLRNEDGERVYDEDDRSEARSMRVKSASIVRRATRLDIEGTVIMIERSAANGKTIAQLADYAAMRGLARTRPPKNSSISSILTLFDAVEGSPMPGLTASDQAYLQALYRFSGTETLSDARSRLSKGIAR